MPTRPVEAGVIGRQPEHGYYSGLVCLYTMVLVYLHDSKERKDPMSWVNAIAWTIRVLTLGA